ncbi:MAG: hypothetical protein D3914_15055 [Candidatus Electrothrix sp. LOE2]|nr:hypothetical protein [Candidatus Electrothrix sp. LOE2]
MIEEKLDREKQSHCCNDYQPSSLFIQLPSHRPDKHLSKQPAYQKEAAQPPVEMQRGRKHPGHADRQRRKEKDRHYRHHCDQPPTLVIVTLQARIGFGLC